MRPPRKIVLVAGISIGAAFLGASAASACFRHTFEPCPAEASSEHMIVLDPKTGRTWVKEPTAAASNVEEMARLAAAAARTLAVRPVSASLATDGSSWQTRVKAAEASARR